MDGPIVVYKTSQEQPEVPGAKSRKVSIIIVFHPVPINILKPNKVIFRKSKKGYRVEKVSTKLKKFEIIHDTQIEFEGNTVMVIFPLNPNYSTKIIIKAIKYLIKTISEFRKLKLVWSPHKEETFLKIIRAKMKHCYNIDI